MDLSGEFESPVEKSPVFQIIFQVHSITGIPPSLGPYSISERGSEDKDRYLKITALCGQKQQLLGSFPVYGNLCRVEERMELTLITKSPQSCTNKLHIFLGQPRDSAEFNFMLGSLLDEDEETSAGLAGHISIDMRQVLQADSEVYLKYIVPGIKSSHKTKLRVSLQANFLCNTELRSGSDCLVSFFKTIKSHATRGDGVVQSEIVISMASIPSKLSEKVNMGIAPFHDRTNEKENEVSSTNGPKDTVRPRKASEVNKSPKGQDIEFQLLQELQDLRGLVMKVSDRLDGLEEPVICRPETSDQSTVTTTHATPNRKVVPTSSDNLAHSSIYHFPIGPHPPLHYAQTPSLPSDLHTPVSNLADGNSTTGVFHAPAVSGTRDGSPAYAPSAPADTSPYPPRGWCRSGEVSGSCDNQPDFEDGEAATNTSCYCGPAAQGVPAPTPHFPVDKKARPHLFDAVPAIVLTGLAILGGQALIGFQRRQCIS